MRGDLTVVGRVLKTPDLPVFFFWLPYAKKIKYDVDEELAFGIITRNGNRDKGL